MRYAVILMVVLGLAGCSDTGTGLLGGAKPDAAAETMPDAAEAPADPDAAATDGAATAAPPPPENARTVEQFDTTTPEQRAAAVQTPPAPATPAANDGRLGTTVASLGAADEPGFWIKTPLVKERKAGRIYYPASDRSVQVQLIPSGGPAGGGSQVSLAAMRLLGAPLTGLPELVVYQN